VRQAHVDLSPDPVIPVSRVSASRLLGIDSGYKTIAAIGAIGRRIIPSCDAKVAKAAWRVDVPDADPSGKQFDIFSEIHIHLVKGFVNDPIGGKGAAVSVFDVGERLQYLGKESAPVE
jgi:hypothetical protein